MTRDSMLAIHVVLGTSGLLLGPAVLLLPHGRLRRAAAIGYQFVVAGVAVSALLLAVTAFSRLWWLVPVAAATESAALLGLLAWRRRRPGWPTACAHLLGGSYVALVTGCSSPAPATRCSGCCLPWWRSGRSRLPSAVRNRRQPPAGDDQLTDATSAMLLADDHADGPGGGAQRTATARHTGAVEGSDP